MNLDRAMYEDTVGLLIASLKLHEGLRLNRYIEPISNKPHIGWGHLVTGNSPDSLKCDTCTRKAADAQLEKDAWAALYDAWTFCGWNAFDAMTKRQKCGIAEMAYQLGLPNLRKFKRMQEAIKALDWQRAILEAQDSLWYRQTPGRAQTVSMRLAP